MRREEEELYRNMLTLRSNSDAELRRPSPSPVTPGQAYAYECESTMPASGFQQRQASTQKISVEPTAIAGTFGDRKASPDSDDHAVTHIQPAKRWVLYASLIHGM